MTTHLRSNGVIGLVAAVVGGCWLGCSDTPSVPADAAGAAVETVDGDSGGCWLGCSDTPSVPADAVGAEVQTVGGDIDAVDDSPTTDSQDETDGGAEADGASGPDGGATAMPLPKFVGNIDTRGSIRSDFATYWNQYTPENSGKWGLVQPTSQASFNWTRLDASYQYCNQHGIVFKQHNFIWGSQQPSWTANLTSDDGPAAVQTWMKEFCARYPNTRIIDVVNEPPPHTTPAYMDAIGGAGSTGCDWIINAFIWARQACPSAQLVLNDYNNIESSDDAQHIIDIVNVLKQAGAPIEAVGCQAHGTLGVSSSTLEANIDKIGGATGLPVYITEYDLDTADDAQQASVMRDQFTMFWNNSNIKGITLWGYIVGNTWVQNSGLVQSDGTMRPAMSWLMQFLGR